jgi:mono/diheme cytochrome c family protein
MRRGVLMVLAAVAAIGVFAGGLGWLLTDARPPAGAPRAQRLYYAYCAECHGVDGRGSWRASLFLLRPSDLTDPRVAAQSDRYLFDIIKHGGATIGRPGMPAFGAQLSDEDIQLLLGYVRTLALRRTGAQRQAHRPVDLRGRTGPRGAAALAVAPVSRAGPLTARARSRRG